jgi:hypothetical protein
VMGFSGFGDDLEGFGTKLGGWGVDLGRGVVIKDSGNPEDFVDFVDFEVERGWIGYLYMQIQQFWGGFDSIFGVLRRFGGFWYRFGVGRSRFGGVG